MIWPTPSRSEAGRRVEGHGPEGKACVFRIFFLPSGRSEVFGPRRKAGARHNEGLTEAESVIVVRPALEKDFPAVTRIQERSPDAAQWPLGDYAGFPLLVALMDSVLAGFCSWRRNAPGEAEILNLAVDPDFRRRGVASALLKAMGEEAQAAVFLEVAEPNAAALALYNRHGWEPIGVRHGYYGNGDVNGIVMKKCSW
jgi:[ribosomal protein S18]-alanine N-acetyltransferase